MLWIKALHVSFVVTWFAGLFYLPRLFIYHADCTDAVSHDRFVVMEQRLFAIMTVGASLGALFGLTLIALAPAYLEQGWLQLKGLLVVGLIAFHIACWRLMQRLKDGRNTRSSRWLRLFNEVPAFFLLTIVTLAIVKPF
jgi:protoporphyrinogen IX oxidase